MAYKFESSKFGEPFKRIIKQLIGQVVSQKYLAEKSSLNRSQKYLRKHMRWIPYTWQHVAKTKIENPSFSSGYLQVRKSLPIYERSLFSMKQTMTYRAVYQKINFKLISPYMQTTPWEKATNKKTYWEIHFVGEKKNNTTTR